MPNHGTVRAGGSRGSSGDTVTQMSRGQGSVGQGTQHRCKCNAGHSAYDAEGVEQLEIGMKVFEGTFSPLLHLIAAMYIPMLDCYSLGKIK